MENFESNGATCYVYRQELAGAELCVIWAHGWGQDHNVFLPMIRHATQMGTHLALDCFGFGKSPIPPGHWGTAEYGDAAAHWIASLPYARRIWVGHSFGCRVGLQVAARHPNLLDGLVLIAPAGLKPKRSLQARLRIRARILAFKILKMTAKALSLPDTWRSRFGSADYRNAGAMRPIFVRVVSEDLSAVAAKVACRTLIICGADDRDTPPEISRRLAAIIPKSELVLLDHADHYTVLSQTYHQVIHRITRFIADIGG